MVNNSPRQNAFRIFTRLVAICAAIVLVYQPVAWAASPASIGQIATKGNAELNGANAVTGATVFSGDRIVSHPDSTASLALTGGSRIVLAGAGAMQVKAEGEELTATLDKGKLGFLSQASAPVVVEAGGTRVTPGKNGGVYVVELDGNKLEVSAYKGGAKVEAANRTVEVPEGKTLLATLEPAQGPPSSAGHSSFAVWAIVALAAAGAITAIVLATTGGKTISPSSLSSPSK
jgi:ferric-dicitrate binding protein FerR (iron transport regulator)